MTAAATSSFSVNNFSTSSFYSVVSPLHNSCHNRNGPLPECASSTYDEIEEAGVPARPLDFPTPTVLPARWVHSQAMDNRNNNKSHEVLLLERRDGEVAYLMKKRLARTVFGSVELCIVLRRRRTRISPLTDEEDIPWIRTDELVAIKASSWTKMRQLRGKHLEDPLKEAACLQLLGNYHPNILGCLEVLQDDEWLYTVMPYCSGGDLYSAIRNRPKQLQYHPQQQQHKRISSDKSTSSESTAFCSSTVPHAGVDETQARLWFRQLLEALLHLQRKGVCHRSLCLENILIEDDGSLVIVDFGLALRVPYADANNPGSISDVSEGTTRLLIRAQGQSGLLTFMAPEILDNEEAFDGFSTDLWSAGVLLFVFLTGLVPFKWPNMSDCRYAQINKGRLRELMACNLEHHVSNEAIDLMQNMMWRDPRQRLTLAQVLQHPWVLGNTMKMLDVTKKTSPTSKKSVQLVTAFPAMTTDKQQLRQVDVR